MKRRLLIGLAIAIAATVGLATYLHDAQAHVLITTDINWSETVRAIYIKKCMPCHHPGGAAPGYADLTFYGDDTHPGANAWRVSAEEQVRTGKMPPWNADPRFGEFSNERRLTQQEINYITAWAEGGGPQGPYQNLPVPEQFLQKGWTYGAPDIIIAMPQGHVVPADQETDVATVEVPVDIEKDTYVTGYEFLVGDPGNVARVTAYVHDPEGLKPEPIEVEVEKPYDPLAGDNNKTETRMREMPEGPHFLGQWTKGDGPILFPDQAGQLLRKGSTIEMRVDYVRPGYADWSKEIRDNTKLGLFIAGKDEEIDRLVESQRIENPEFTIKAGEQKQVEAKLTFDENVELIGLNPHLGPLATKFKMKVNYPDGLEKVLLWVPEYHQSETTTYRLKDPVAAPAGTVMTLTGWYDNTADNWDNPNDPPEDMSTGPKWKENERLYAMVDYMLKDHLKTVSVFVPKKQEPEGGGMLGGFGPETTKADDSESTVEDITKGIVASLEVPEEPDRVRPAKDGYHQIQGTMTKPGHFMLYVYDDNMNPLDPRNFSGSIQLKGSDNTQPLVHQLPTDGFLSAYLPPTFPQEFEATLNLGDEKEVFPFRFEKLVEPDKEKSETPPAPAKQAYVQPPHGGWLDTIEQTGHQVEATMEEAGKLHLYFYDKDMNPVDPRNFRGLVLLLDPDSGKPGSSKTLLKHPDPRAEYLEAAISPELPVAVQARIWVGNQQDDLEFEFDELTEEPWDWGPAGGAAAADPPKPLIVGPHGSPEFYEASNGFHFVEAAMPRPGEFRLYFYDGWKNQIDPGLFTGSVKVGDAKKDLVRFQSDDQYLSAFVDPELPATLQAKVWITGKEEEFTFNFDDVTVDPATQVNAGAAHMDHKPLHGGQFFMADNMFHHLEGTMPIPGEFHMYFYDNYKKPIDPRNFAGTVYIEHLNDDTGEVTETEYKMVHAQNTDEYLTAILEGDDAKLPTTLYTMVNLGGEMKRFDFAFDALTVEPPRAPSMSTAPQSAAAAAATHSHYRPPLTIPDTVRGILDAVQARQDDLVRRIAAGDWVTLYQPALDIKDLIDALAKKDPGLSVREKGRVKLLVGQINFAADRVDNVAHTQDPPRVQAVADDLAEGIKEFENIYGPKAK